MPVLVVALLVPVLVGCGSDDTTSDSTTTTTRRRRTLDGTAHRAWRRRRSPTPSARSPRRSRPPTTGVDVELSFDGSAKLATAIIEGAPADLFASADEANLDQGRRRGPHRAASRSIFATNVLQIVVPEGNPLGIDSLDDLTSPDVTLSLCGPEVPCGKYAAQAFETAGLEVPPAGDQENVKGVLTQVQLGEADAGIVYVTDVLAADDVEGIDLAADQQVEATYPASVLAEASNPDAAAAFLAFLTGDEAQSILEDFGFGPP